MKKEISDCTQGWKRKKSKIITIYSELFNHYTKLQIFQVLLQVFLLQIFKSPIFFTLIMQFRK